MNSRVLIVDDEESILSALRRVLRIAPCTYGRLRYHLDVETFSSPMEALKRAAETSFDLIMSDYRMPEMDGVAFLSRARELQPDAARLVLSGYADLDAIMRAFDQAQIFRFVAKPWNDYILLSTIAEALNHRDILLENRQLAQAAGLGAPAGGSAASPAAEPQPARWGADGSVIAEPKAD
ncbi:MAG: response regulator [Gammaproteobacteria bacterium]|nr:response regulator [Gammaproteobacteria bacterium]MBU1646093.1 response regulator [Gammaproteobacteria bacterium]MBU1972155.1 response regulator [Gammaproteobacteria bacterium]